jgi:signal transduction histidine kinase
LGNGRRWSFVYHPINFKLRQITNIVTDILKTLAIKKNIQLINEVDENLKIYADMHMITSLIQNLVSNALKFTDIDGSGKVYIKPNLRAILLKLRLKILVWDDRRQIQNLFQPRMTVSLKALLVKKVQV